MRLGFTIVIVILYSCFLSGQIAKHKLDSLLSLQESPPIANAISHLEEIDSLAEVEGDTRTQSDCLLFLSTIYTSTKNYINADRVISKALWLSDSSNQVPSDFRPMALNNAANFELRKGNVRRATTLLLQALSLGKKADASNSTIQKFYHNIADNYRSIGDFENAISSCESSISYLELLDNGLDNKVALAHEFLNLGLVNYELGRKENSIDNFKSGLDILSTFPLSAEAHTKIMIALIHSLSYALIEYGRIGKAKSTLQELVDIPLAKTYRSFNIYECNGMIATNREGAQKEFRIALEIAYQYYGDRKNLPTIGRLHGRLADLHIQSMDYDSALYEIQRGLQFYDKSLSSDINDHPSLQEISVFPKTLDLLLKKGQAAKLVGYQDAATNSYLLAIDMLDQLKSSYIINGSKYFVSSKAQPIYKEVLEYLYMCYKDDPSPQIMEQIYSVMERNKSNILFDKVKYKFDLLASDIPKEVVEKSHGLDIDLAYYTKLLEEEVAKSDQDLMSVDKYKKKIFELREEAAFHDQYMKENHSDFYSYKNQITEIEPLKNIQSTLDAKSVIIEYFIQDSTIFRLSITKSKVDFEDLSDRGILEKILSVSKSLATTPEKSTNHQLESQLKSLGENLLNEDILRETDHFIVVADGILRKIPFSALRIARDGKDDFLIQSHGVSNYFSIQQYAQSENSKVTGKSEVLCLAPEFEGVASAQRSCYDTTLGKLPFAIKEKEYLEQEFEGLYFSSKNVKTTDLTTNLNDFEIVHLATHACLDTENPMLSKIHFNDGSLSNYEIQNLNVQPELVVLSACNTAQGSNQEGEGVISLTRGFFEAGVKSLQSSLWAIDDYSSSEIVKGMYGHLKSGQTKSEALRNSKLDYLKTADRLRSHPYYWAGMIHIGNDQSLFSPAYSSLVWVIVSFFIGVLVFLFISIRNKKFQRSI